MYLSILIAFSTVLGLLSTLLIMAKVRDLRKDVNAAHARLDRIAPVTLEDLGIEVTGCSACAHTPENEKCPGCGNQGLVPVKVKPVRKTRKRRK